MGTTTTFTVDRGTAHDVAAFINSAVAGGATVHVDGVLAARRYGQPAKAWGTGSLSVDTPARYTRGHATYWWKEGATVQVVVE